MILVDTSGLWAWLDDDQPDHTRTVEAMAEQVGPFLLSPFVFAELDYLLGTRVGESLRRAFSVEVAAGAFRLVPFEQLDVVRACEVMEMFDDLKVGLTDASICVLAARFRCSTVLTLDERHFRVLQGPEKRPFKLLPADAD